jgi:multiple sugar transport system substrate-binding protein
MAIRRLATLFLLLLLFVLPGCASASLPLPELSVLAPEGVEEAALQAALVAFHESSALRVHVETLGEEFYSERAAALLLSGNNEVDLLLLPGDSLAYWASYHALHPFSQVDDHSLQPWAAALQVAGEQYGLPAQLAVEGIWYRADLLAAAGLPVPRTWDELRAAALALNDPLRVYGAAVAGSSLDAGGELAAVLAGFGGQVIGDDYRVQVDSVAGQQAFGFYAGWFAAGGGALPGAAEATRHTVQDALAQGRAAIGIAPLAVGARLRDCAASPKACAEGKPLLEWAWLPGLEETQAYGSLSAWAIPLRAAHPQAAEAFARWLCGVEGSMAWASGGGTPANRSALAALGPEGQALAQVETYLRAFPPFVEYERLWKVVNDAAHAAAAGQAPPSEVLEKAAAELEALLRQEGY